MSRKVKVNKINKRKFEIVTPQRTYYFKGLDAVSTEEWVNDINATIRDYCPEV